MNNNFVAIRTLYKLRACQDCNYLVQYVTLWCKNDDCMKWRGTRYPDVKHCPFWEPNRLHIIDEVTHNGYIIYIIATWRWLRKLLTHHFTM
jgi:hypothetical protein